MRIASKGREVDMTNEGFNRRFEQKNAGKELPIADPYIQLEMMKFAFDEEEHLKPADQRNLNPTRKDIATRWLEKHASNWRHVIATHEEDRVDTSDPMWRMRCYQMLSEDESGPTIH